LGITKHLWRKLQGVHRIGSTPVDFCLEAVEELRRHWTTARNTCPITSRRRSLSLASRVRPPFARAPESNGCAERFIRTLKENLLWVRTFETIEELRQALLAFRET
jgi:hypothetical protein